MNIFYKRKNIDKEKAQSIRAAYTLSVKMDLFYVI
jgi:hypothetical protein